MKNNPYIKKYQFGGEGDPEDPIKGILNFGLTPQNTPVPGLGGQPYQQTPTYAYNWNTTNASTPTTVHLPSGTYNTQQQIEKKKKTEERKEAFWNTVAAGDKAIGQYLFQPAAELFNTPFATVAEGVNAIQGKEYDFGKVLPNPTRMALNAEGMGDMVPQQQFLSDYLGVDRKENPYLALGLDIFTPGPAMVTKPLQALTGIGKASTGAIKYASKMNTLERAIDNPLAFAKKDLNPFYVNEVNPNVGLNFADQSIDASKVLQQAEQNVLNAARQPQVAASTTQAVAKEYTPWAQQEMPGLHIKSTMTGSPFEKQLSKTGELNVSNVQAHINRADVSQQDKFILQKVLNEKFAGKQKVDYNEFRKAVSEELVPLQRNILDNDEFANYGTGNLKYPGIKPESYKSAIENIIEEERYFSSVKDLKKENLRKITDNGVEKYVVINRFGRTEYIPVDKIDNWFNYVAKDADNFYKDTYPKKAEYEKLLSEMPETKTLTYENIDKFGKGDARHYSNSTLAHTRTLVSKEEPDVMHYLEQQSDYWQSGPGKNPVKIDYEKWSPRIDKMEKSLADDYAHLEYMKKNRKSISGDNMDDYQIAQFEERLIAKEKDIKFNRGDMANPEQKEFLGKAHQERLLQENIKYAVEQGKQKARYPTRETAAKIQSYSPVKKALSADEIKELESRKKGLEYAISEHYATYGNDPNYQFPYLKKMEEELAEINKYKYQPGKDIYSDRHETILRKYQETPKMIEKTLGVKVNIVTDAKGNTWYEFDIPDAYKKGKAEIKALSINPILGGGAVGAAGATGASQLNQQAPQNRYGGQNPYMKYANGGPIDPVDPEDEKRLMQERLMSYIRGNNESGKSILNVRAPNEYGFSLGDKFNIQSGLSLDPMTGMPSGYGKLGINTNGFNLGVEKRKGLGTNASTYNLGYNSPKFNIDASYSNENNMPSFRGNVGYNNNGINIGVGGNYSPNNKSISANLGYNKNGFNAGLNYDYSGQHSMSGNVGYGNNEYNVGLSGNIMPSESNIGLNATYNLGVRKPQKREEISMAYNKPIEINLIKEDDDIDTNAEQAAGPPEMNYGGYVNPEDPTLPSSPTNLFSNYDMSYKNPFVDDMNAAMNGMMKARMAIDSEIGMNPAAKRMTSLYPKEYKFTGDEMFYDEKVNVPAGATGTHYTTGDANVMFPIIQENKEGNLFFNRYASPMDKEAMRFETPEEASYFGENYKNIAPMMYNQQEYGKGGDAGHSTVEIERSERVYTPDGKPQ